MKTSQSIKETLVLLSAVFKHRRCDTHFRFQ